MLLDLPGIRFKIKTAGGESLLLVTICKDLIAVFLVTLNFSLHPHTATFSTSNQINNGDYHGT